MKLNRLYSNLPEIVEPIQFNDGFSAVFAEIRVPENRDRDTHNLGKTKVGELIDFCLLKGKSSKFFLFKHEERFAQFTFFLEVCLPGGDYLTIRRPVAPGSRIDFIRRPEGGEDLTNLDPSSWDHSNVPFETAKTLLDGILDIEALQPWPFRKLVGYLIRSQQDYLDVFQLGKFSGKHEDWKPFVAHLLGMNGDLAIDLYEVRGELERSTAALSTLTQEWGGEDAEPSVLAGLISVKRREIAEKQEVLGSFNFQEEDSRVTAEVVEDTEMQIAGLNEERYNLSQVISQLESSLESKRIGFKPGAAETLFAEAGIVFPDQIKNDYEQLIAFNRAITKERLQALGEQLTEATERVDQIEKDLGKLNSQRSKSLEFLRQSDGLAKFKELSEELTTLRADLNTLEAKRDAAARLIELRRDQRILEEKKGHLETKVETEIEQISSDEQGRFGRIRRYFDEITSNVLGRNAIIAIKLNSKGGIDFSAEFVGESGTATSADKGTSYKKLLCIAFDLAVLRAYLDVPFPRFVYHDGALEQLEPRKQEKLISVFREYASYGLQPVISLLDSDLPAELDTDPKTISTSDIILTLHDQDQNGLLFRMPTW